MFVYLSNINTTFHSFLGGGVHDEEMHQKQKDYNIAIMFVIQIIFILYTSKTWKKYVSNK